MIQPEYEVGQRVWGVEILDETRQTPCPDCLGTKWWPITVPGGDTFDLECATCQYGYEVRGFLTVHTVTAVAMPLTVGSIRTDTASTDRPIEYMMIETGVECGRVWSEADVFATEADAQLRLGEKRAEVQAAHENREAARIAKNKTSTRKPTYHERRIRELEKEVETLKRNKP